MGIGYIPPKDTSGRAIHRSAATINGWHYHAREFEISCSKLAGVQSYDEQNAAYTDFSVKIYDSQGAEITQQANEGNAVRTQLIWSPSTDYEILGGKLRQHTRPTADIRMSAVGGPVDLGFAYCKPFVPSMNLRYICPELGIETDGRASKYMALTIDGVPVPTNKFMVNVYYPQGNTHEFAMIFEVFKG